jgi:hypothetical protein
VSETAQVLAGLIDNILWSGVSFREMCSSQKFKLLLIVGVSLNYTVSL